MKDDGKRCCICGKAYEGYGHNPWPVRESGRCCRECNYRVVLQARMENFMKTK